MHRARHSAAAPDRRLVEGLLRPEAFPHPADAPELIETHISWVVLAGGYAYKIKKPLDLGFLDFSTLERRRYFCEEELRLNRPSAPSIYLDVVTVTLGRDGPRIGGDGEVVDYALRMRRFDQSLRLDRQLADGALSVADMRELGEAVAARHEAAPRVDPRQREHQVATTGRFIRDNFAALEAYVDEGVLSRLREWSELELAHRERTLYERFDEGWVRDCHGDLHLGNLVRLDGRIVLFDCIEFDADLRAIDVICDVAFLAMDLVSHGRRELAAHFLNRYLERTGDYAGVALLDLYFVYRSLVLAKVEAINSEECAEPAERAGHLAQVRRHADIALRQISKPPAVLVLMHGLSGSGKTWVSSGLMAALPAIRIRSDVERRRLSGLAETAPSGSALAGGIYTPDTSAQVYARLSGLAEELLSSHHSVVLDATFLGHGQRTAALDAARRAGAVAVIVDVSAPDAILRRRIAARAARPGDASEAGPAVLDHQRATAEPLTDSERAITISFCNDDGADIPRLAAGIRARARSRPAGGEPG